MVSKYHSFLVRIWKTENNHNTTWHISLESPAGGEKRYFSNLDDLHDFFANLMRQPSVVWGDPEGDFSPEVPPENEI